LNHEDTKPRSTTRLPRGFVPSWFKGIEPSIWTSLGLFLLPFILFFRATLGLAVFFVHDIQYYFFPYRKVAADIVRSGHLPLWNPYCNAGMPLLGDGQTALLYPPNWLIFILPTAHALTLAILSTFSIAGVGMYFYLRQIRSERTIAAIGALGFMFCGFFVSHLSHVSIPATAALIPWIFWGCERLMHRPSAVNFALVGAKSCEELGPRMHPRSVNAVLDVKLVENAGHSLLRLTGPVLSHLILVSSQNELPRGSIFLLSHPSVIVRVRNLSKCIRRDGGFVRLQQDVTIVVVEFEGPVHQHPVAFEQRLRSGHGFVAGRHRLGAGNCRRHQERSYKHPGHERLTRETAVRSRCRSQRAAHRLVESVGAERLG